MIDHTIISTHFYITWIYVYYIIVVFNFRKKIFLIHIALHETLIDRYAIDFHKSLPFQADLKKKNLTVLRNEESFFKYYAVIIIVGA